MNNIFKKNSWEKEKINTVNNTNPVNTNVLSDDTITLKYIKPIFFDEIVQIDIEYIGKFQLNVNNHTEMFSSENDTTVTVTIDNYCIDCNNNKFKLDKSDNLKVILNNKSNIKSFTVIQDLKINGCNPSNE